MTKKDYEFQQHCKECEALTRSRVLTRKQEVAKSLDTAQDWARRVGLLMQRDFNGCHFKGFHGFDSGMIVNNFMCYNWKHSDPSENAISFEDIWESLPYYRQEDCNCDGKRRFTICDNYPVYMFFDCRSTAFDAAKLHSDITRHFEVARDYMLGSYKANLNMISWILNNFDCFVDDQLRSQYEYTALWCQSIIFSCFFATIHEMVSDGLILFISNDEDDPQSLILVDSNQTYFYIAYAKHLWNMIGDISYPEEQEYEWTKSKR